MCRVRCLHEAVVERQPPRLKTWETEGEPRLVVIGNYCMGFQMAPSVSGSLLTVFIDSRLPSGQPGRWLGRALAHAYARWCCARMVEDAQQAFSGLALQI